MNKCQFPGTAGEFRYMNEEAFDNIHAVDRTPALSCSAPR